MTLARRAARWTLFLVCVLVVTLTLVTAPKAPAHATAQPVTAPITLLPLNPGFRPTVEIRLPGMTHNVKVSLDTGSSGLVILASAITEATPTTTGISADMGYLSCPTISGFLVQDDVQLMDGDTVKYTAPNATMLSVDTVTCTSGDWPSPSEVVGTLGIGQGINSYANGANGFTASPFTFDTSNPEYGTFTKVHLDSKTLGGTLTLGDGSAIAGGTTFHSDNQVDSNFGHDTYANGLTARYHMVSDVCWEILGKSDCAENNDTTFDTGAPGGFAGAETWKKDFTALAELPEGTDITLRQKVNGANPEFGHIIVSNPSFGVNYHPGKPSYNPSSRFTNNTGSGFLLDRDLLLNFDEGTVTLGPNELPITGITLGIDIGDFVTDAPVAVAEQGLKSDVDFDVSVHSDPQVMTVGKTNGLGRVFADTRLPAGLGAGWHTISFTTKGYDGKDFVDNLWIKVSADGRLLAVTRELADTGASPNELAAVGLTGLGLTVSGVLAVLAVTLLRRRRGVF